jgi:hypothetical protein
MRFGAAALVAAFICTSGAAWAADPMATTYGNTVTSKNLKTGASAALLFNGDGTYTTKVATPDGKSIEIPGTWTVKDGGATLCLKSGLPPGAPPPPSPPAENCSPLAVHAIGEHWTVTNTMGDSFDVVVTAGR